MTFTTLAGFAAIAALWTHIKSFFNRLRALLIQKTVIWGDAAVVCNGYIQRHCRVVQWSDDLFSSRCDWVRPLEKFMIVIHKYAPTTPALAFYRGRPFLFCNPANNREGQNNAIPERLDTLNIYTFRWSISIKELTWAALESQAQLKSETVRYLIYKIGGRDKRLPHESAQLAGIQAAQRAPNQNLIINYLHWKQEEVGAPKPREPFDTYCLCQTTHDAREDFKRWISLKMWYMERGIPWRRGHLYYGQPGTGKTALVRALAQEANMPVYCYDLSTLSNEELSREWTCMLENTPCVALIEDVDGVFHGRTNVLHNQGSSLTFDCLLNTIGGIQVADGVFLAVTTNKPELLDDALGQPKPDGTTTRPGRLDRSFKIDLPDETQRACILRKIADEATPEMLDATSGMSAAQVVEYAMNHALAKTWNLAP